MEYNENCYLQYSEYVDVDSNLRVRYFEIPNKCEQLIKKNVCFP